MAEAPQPLLRPVLPTFTFLGTTSVSWPSFWAVTADWAVSAVESTSS